MTPTLDTDSAQKPLLPSPSSSSIADENDSQSIKLTRNIEDTTIPEESTLGRNLSWSSTYILTISRVIGSGIFATPGSIVKTTGSVGLALLLWVVGAVIAYCTMIVGLEYGCMLPRSGGDKVYLEFTYQHPRFFASTLFAVLAVLLGFTASNCIIFGEYVLFAFGIEPTELSQKSLALGLLTVITIIHGCFLETGIRIQNFLGWVKVGLILFMALTGIYVVLFRSEKSEITSNSSATSAWDSLWKGSNWGWGTLSTAIFKVSYSYTGLANVNNVLNEVKNPVRTLRSVLPTALLTACLLYLLVNFAYLSVVPLQEVKDSGEMIAALFFQRVFGAHLGKTILPLAIAVSAAGNVMVVTFTLVSRSLIRQLKAASLTLVIGARESRNRPAGLSSFLKTSFVITPIQCSNGRSVSTLYPVFPGDCNTTKRGCV